MGISQGNFSSGPHGLTANEFGLVDGIVMVKNKGLSGMTHPQAGRFVFTFAVAKANTSYFVKCAADGVAQLGTVKANLFAKATTGFTIDVAVNNTTNVDPLSLHVAIFE
jgi:hypothetical protein